MSRAEPRQLKTARSTADLLCQESAARHKGEGGVEVVEGEAAVDGLLATHLTQWNTAQGTVSGALNASPTLLPSISARAVEVQREWTGATFCQWPTSFSAACSSAPSRRRSFEGAVDDWRREDGRRRRRGGEEKEEGRGTSFRVGGSSAVQCRSTGERQRCIAPDSKLRREQKVEAGGEADSAVGGEGDDDDTQGGGA